VKTAPYGTWASPLSASAVAAGSLRLGAVQLDGDDIYWLEGRPREGGRSVLVRRSPDGSIAEVVPSEFNVRSRVHEYGGGAYIVRDGVAYCVNFSDQRVYRIARADSPDAVLVPEALTPAGSWRYADFDVDVRRQRLICVREDHAEEGREPINTIVSIPVGPANRGDGHYDPEDGPAEAGHYVRPEIIASGYEFYSTPRLSPDGNTLAWLSWRHPAMPWDVTELWVADIDAAGALANATRVAGGDGESIYQPGWSPNGALYYVSDRTGWWQLYRSDRLEPSGRSDRAVIRNPPDDAEFGRPAWVFGTATWACAGPSQLIVSFTQRGRWHLARVDVASGLLSPIAPELQPDEWIAANATSAVVVAGSDTAPDCVVRIDLATGDVVNVRAAAAQPIAAGYISVPEAIEFPTADSRTAHAFYYPPQNQDFMAPVGDTPPLIAISHGGPTAAASAALDLQIQYWTSRGFALVDVNYGGSSGSGRAYRERLNGNWGIVDVADVTSAALFLCQTGRGDAGRLIIRGGSAGGYTTLAALTFHAGIFKAGASYYGISDLEVLEVDTHKFESRYSNSLIGPYPETRDIYRARSPIHAIDRLACPLILFQGLEDKVVPPNQSQMMADAVREKGLPVAYLSFEGEQHGFRRAETIARCLEAELYFYGKVFGFTPADPIEPVAIQNL
jgi:dipeptidyl aminopeptidase/acylaminoacyl peptidase